MSLFLNNLTDIFSQLETDEIKHEGDVLDHPALLANIVQVDGKDHLFKLIGQRVILNNSLVKTGTLARSLRVQLDANSHDW